MNKKLIILVFAVIGSSLSVKAQTAVNIGYQENEFFSSVTVGGLFEHIDMDLFITAPDLGDDSNFIFGGRVGYMFYLYNESQYALYAGPHVGGYSLTRDNNDGSGFTETENEFSLNYGGTAGIYLDPLNIAVGYGFDDLLETEYFHIKVGINVTSLLGN